MIKEILKWGVVSGVVMVSIAMISLMSLGDLDAQKYRIAEIIGYTGILLALLFIYVGMHRYFAGDKAKASLWHRIGFGLGITLVSGLMFGAFNNFYVAVINPDYMAQSFEIYAAQIVAPNEAEHAILLAELKQQFELFQSPWIMFVVMASTVWMIGIVISLVSAVVHKYVVQRKNS